MDGYWVLAVKSWGQNLEITVRCDFMRDLILLVNWIQPR